MAEIVAMAALFGVSTWIWAPRVATAGHVAAFWMFLIGWGAFLGWVSPFLIHRDPPDLRGWRAPGELRSNPGAFAQAWRPYATYTLLGAVLLVLAAFARDMRVVSSIDWASVALKFSGYVLWGLIQAAVFYGYLQARLRDLFHLPVGAPYGRRAAVMSIVQAALFAAAHLPNLPLAGLVFVGGLGWSRLFYSRPNLLLLGLSHAVLGTLVHRVLQISTRIGPFYDHPEWHLAQRLIPGLHRIFGDLF